MKRCRDDRAEGVFPFSMGDLVWVCTRSRGTRRRGEGGYSFYEQYYIGSHKTQKQKEEGEGGVVFPFESGLVRVCTRRRGQKRGRVEGRRGGRGGFSTKKKVDWFSISCAW